MLYIFEVTVKPGYSVDQYAQGWLEASRIIQQNPGARGTWLHRKIDDPDTLLAIAHWASRQERDAKDDSQSETVRAILARHALHCDFRLIGEYEDADWHVPPGS